MLRCAAACSNNAAERQRQAAGRQRFRAVTSRSDSDAHAASRSIRRDAPRSSAFAPPPPNAEICAAQRPLRAARRGTAAVPDTTLTLTDTRIVGLQASSVSV